MRRIVTIGCLLALAACGGVADWWRALPEDAVRQPDGTWIGTENICWRGGGPMFDTPGCIRKYRYTADGEIIERIE